MCLLIWHLQLKHTRNILFPWLFKYYLILAGIRNHIFALDFSTTAVPCIIIFQEAGKILFQLFLCIRCITLVYMAELQIPTSVTIRCIDRLVKVRTMHYCLQSLLCHWRITSVSVSHYWKLTYYVNLENGVCSWLNQTWKCVLCEHSNLTNSYNLKVSCNAQNKSSSK